MFIGKSCDGDAVRISRERRERFRDRREFEGIAPSGDFVRNPWCGA